MILLDANAFMEASRLYYSFRIAPGYWEWLVGKFEAGEVASVGAVYDEIAAGYGDLVNWARDPALNGFWLPDTAESFAAAGQLATWASHPHRPFKQAAVDEFMGSADLRLAAQACAMGATVATRETSDARPGEARQGEARQGMGALLADTGVQVPGAHGPQGLKECSGREWKGFSWNSRVWPRT